MVAVPRPAKGNPLGMGGRKSHVVLRSEGTELPVNGHNETFGTQGRSQQVEIVDQSGQDGEMGHEIQMPACSDTSQILERDPLELIVPTIGAWPQFSPPLRIGVMASGSGSNLEALYEATAKGCLEASLQLLIVNNPGCGARERAERLRIPCQLIDHREHNTRESLDHALVSAFRAADVEAVVMAGWMRIVTPVLIDAYAGRLINLHPSLLPAFKGLDAVGQALAAGVRIAGCSVHHVQADVDSGAVIAQAAVPVLASDNAETLAKRIQRQEHRLLPWATALAGLEWRGEGQACVQG